MFLSYKETGDFTVDSETRISSWQYKIIDSEFEEVNVATTRNYVIDIEVAAAVIDTYEKRNLNVAANLIKAFVWYDNKYGWPVNDQVEWNKAYNPKFAKYEVDVNKYLILL